MDGLEVILVVSRCRAARQRRALSHRSSHYGQTPSSHTLLVDSVVEVIEPSRQQDPPSVPFLDVYECHIDDHLMLDAGYRGSGKSKM